MGRGIARQARDRFPSLDLALGRAIEHLTFYGLLVSPAWPDKRLGAFQVKLAYNHAAELSIIEHSVAALNAWALDHPDADVHLNYPGIGNGGLAVQDVEPLILGLPDNVYIWRYK